MSGGAEPGSAESQGRSESFSERLAFRGYAGVEWLATHLPERAGRRAFDVIGRLAHALGSKRRTIVAANFAQVLGRPADDPLVRAATRDAYRSYARYWFETFHLQVWKAEDLFARTTHSGKEHVDEAVAAGTGCLVVLSHLGNWDAGGAWLAATGVPTVAVAEDLRPRRLMELFVRHRESLGVRIVVLEQGGGVMKKLVGHLRDSRAVGLVADRDLSGRGIEVEMFGATRRIPAGPATLSLMTGAPILPTAVYMTPDNGWRVVIDSPLDFEPTGDRKADVVALTRLMAKEMERMIAADPVQWHIFQPGWP